MRRNGIKHTRSVMHGPLPGGEEGARGGIRTHPTGPRRWAPARAGERRLSAAGRGRGARRRAGRAGGAAGALPAEGAGCQLGAGPGPPRRYPAAAPPRRSSALPVAARVGSRPSFFFRRGVGTVAPAAVGPGGQGHPPRAAGGVCARRGLPLMTVILTAMLQWGRVCGAARELYNAAACKSPSALRS